MSVNEIDRLKEDIEVIKEAAGLELPFSWRDVWYNIEFMGLGLLMVLLAFFLQNLVLLLFILLLGALSIEFVLPCHRTRTETSTTGNRRRKLHLCEVAVVTILVIGYIIWSHKLDFPIAFREGAMFLLCGCALALKAFSRYGNLHSLGYAIPMMLCGILLPLLEVSFGILCGITLAISGATTAAIQTYYLKKNRITNDTN